MPKCVLLVDDEEDIRDILKDLLESRGYHVLVAGNGREALDFLHASEPPCFVLLDLIMPVMDGWEFLAAVGSDAALAEVPIYISTSAPERAPAGRRVLPKPLDLEKLLDCVRGECGPGAGC